MYRRREKESGPVSLLRRRMKKTQLGMGKRKGHSIRTGRYRNLLNVARTVDMSPGVQVASRDSWGPLDSGDLQGIGLASGASRAGRHVDGAGPVAASTALERAAIDAVPGSLRGARSGQGAAAGARAAGWTGGNNRHSRGLRRNGRGARCEDSRSASRGGFRS